MTKCIVFRGEIFDHVVRGVAMITEYPEPAAFSMHAIVHTRAPGSDLPAVNGSLIRVHRAGHLVRAGFGP